MKKSLPLLVLVAGSFALVGCQETATAPPEKAASTDLPAAAFKVEHLDAAGAAKLLAENDQVLVVDVRTPAEFAEGHIEGAVNRDFKAEGFAGSLADLDKARPWLVHCRSGGRSTSSLETLKASGAGLVYHLDGGFNAWTAGGNAVAK